MTKGTNESGPDVRQLGEQTLPGGTFPGGKKSPFRIYFEPSVHKEIWKHCNENTTVEVCGVLVGQWAKDFDGPYVHVRELIRGEAAASKFAEVTFTHETWAKINHEMD